MNYDGTHLGVLEGKGYIDCTFEPIKLIPGSYEIQGTVRSRDGLIQIVRSSTFLKFQIVYDMDEDNPIADGFYFTFSYPGFSGEELLSDLIYYGISAISLAITGSTRKEGIRACVSLVHRDQFADLEIRLKKFNQDHPI